MTAKTVAISMGDPLGIGPEVIVKALNAIGPRRGVRFCVVGDQAVFSKTAAFVRLLRRGDVSFFNVAALAKKKDTKWAGQAAYLALEVAVDLIKQGLCHALVTAPICKAHMQMAGFKFPGHTEYLCHEFHITKFAMMLFNTKLRVVLCTIHEPLKKIPELITKKLIVEKLQLTTASLKKKFYITRPRIAVCGLNPHAGEVGLMGDEEKKTITPAIAAFRQNTRGVTVTGPVAPDTVFYRALRGEFDVVLCLYHDQGLIPIKTTGFDEGVNMTLGLPFVRTSPDHGTAFDIAGKNKACAKSMLMAIEVAIGAQKKK